MLSDTARGPNKNRVSQDLSKYTKTIDVIPARATKDEWFDELSRKTFLVPRLPLTRDTFYIRNALSILEAWFDIV